MIDISLTLQSHIVEKYFSLSRNYKFFPGQSLLVTIPKMYHLVKKMISNSFFMGKERTPF